MNPSTETIDGIKVGNPSMQVNERVSVIEAVLAHLAGKEQLERLRTEVRALQVMMKMQFACTLVVLAMVGALFMRTLG